MDSLAGSPNLKLNDDIAAICARTGIDPSCYRSFSAEAEPAVAEAPAPPEEVAAAPAASVIGPGIVPPAPRNRLEPALRPVPRWRVLRSVFNQAHSGSQQEEVGARRTLPRGSLSMIGACGGVGVTSILATLARIQSQRHERILIVDGTAQSMLPYYFGAPGTITGSCSFLPLRGGSDGSLSVVSRDPEDPAPDARIWQNIRNSAGSVDRVLLDIWRDMAAPGWQIVTAESVCLVVLVPDLHSVVRLRTIERLFQGRDAAFGRTTPYYLLNKFDSSLALHVDLRNWLAQETGDRLLPIAIRRSDEVTQSLAEGLTVADYAPNSGITQDFHALADWLSAVSVNWHSSALAAHAG